MSEADRDQAIQLLNDAKMASDANQKASLLLSFTMSQNSCHNQSYSAENIVVTFHRRWQDICCWRSAKRFLDPLYVFHYCAVHFQVDLLKGLTELIVHKQPALLSVRHTRTASS